MKKSKYIWEKKTDVELQLWPDGSRELYLTDSFIPADIINKKSGKVLITTPDNIAQDFLKYRGILSAGVSNHKRGFYQQRAGADFNTLIYTTSGEAKIKFNGKNHKLKTGDVFACKTGESYVISCDNGDWDLFWFHLENTDNWKALFNIPLQIKKSPNFDKLKTVIELYTKEVYRELLSPSMLESYAVVIGEYLKRDFVVEVQNPEILALEKLLIEVRRNLNKTWTAASVAKRLGMGVKHLNTLCNETHSETFSKFLFRNRMLKAFEMLSVGRFTYAEIATQTGYSDAYAFSKAFKLYYGKSPNRFFKERY